MRIGGVAFRPNRAIPRAWRLMCDARGPISKVRAARCINGWVAAKLGRSKKGGPGAETLLDLPSLRLLVDASRGEIIPYLEIWREHCYDALPQFAKSGMGLVVDVGANIGTFSLYQAICKRARRVVAFEPAPSVFARLSRNLELNRTMNVLAIPNAVGETAGMVSFVERSMSINCRVAQPDEIGAIQIPCVTLDDVLRDFGEVDLLKVDAEGYESNVLMGANNVLRRTHRVVIEAVTPSDRQKVHAILQPYRFRLCGKMGEVFYYDRP